MVRRMVDRLPLVSALAALGFGLWMVAATAIAGGEVVITTTAELRETLATANSGDILVLAPGTYGAPDLKTAANREAGGDPIIIRSQDPANPAVLTGMKVKGAVGLVMEGLVFDYTFAPGDNGPDKKGINWPFQVLGSTDIIIRNSLFDGDLATEGAPYDVGFPTATGLVVRGTRGLTLEGNVFTLWGRAMAIDSSARVEILRNDIHSIRMDGMNLAAINGILIEGNHIHDFKRSLDSKDHADMLQFWTAGTKSPSKGITIRGNLFDSGTGYYTQSIFMRNELVDQKKAGKEMFYSDVLIEQNVIINAHLHGITLGESIGLTIRNNTLIHNRTSDGPDNNPKLWIPRINVSGASEQVTITGNISDQTFTPRGRADWVVQDNLAVQDRNAGGPGHYDKVFMAARTGDPADISIYAYRPGGPADGATYGAAALRPDQFASLAGSALAGAALTGSGLTDSASVGAAKAVVVSGNLPAHGTTTLTAFVQAIPDDRYLNRFRFDASQSFIPDQGGVASYDWLIDGETATGPVVQRDFATPGPHLAKLVLRMADGQTDEASATVDVPKTEVLRFDSATGTILAQGPKGETTLTDLPLTDLPLTDLPLAGSDGGKALVPGGDKPYQIAPALIGGLFGSSDFTLKLRFRTSGAPRAAGEILRVHQLLVLNVAPNGSAELQLFAAGAKQPQVVKTAPLRLQDGQWHDLEVRFDSMAGKVGIWVDGALKSTGRTTGPVGPRQSWGLSLGNPFGQKSLDGQISTLSLHSNEARFAR